MIGIQLYTLGNVLHNKGAQHSTEARGYLEQALSILECTHGRGSSLVASLLELMAHLDL
jgi:hypothetical protein